jgi:hypothetical protein
VCLTVEICRPVLSVLRYSIGSFWAKNHKKTLSYRYSPNSATIHCNDKPGQKKTTTDKIKQQIYQILALLAKGESTDV